MERVAHVVRRMPINLLLAWFVPFYGIAFGAVIYWIYRETKLDEEKHRGAGPNAK